MPDHDHAGRRVQEVLRRAVVEHHVVVHGEDERVALGNLVREEHELEYMPVTVGVAVRL